MTSHLIFLILLLLPTCVFADTGWNAAVLRLLNVAGALPPVTLSVPQPGHAANKILISGSNLLGSKLLVRLRCDPVFSCREFYATLTYANTEEAMRAHNQLQDSFHRRTEKNRTVIRAGDRVSLLLEVGRVRLRLPVEVLNSGAIGESVRVRDRQSQKVLQAVAMHAGEVNAQ
jgi:hypothetical protein